VQPGFDTDVGDSRIFRNVVTHIVHRVRIQKTLMSETSMLGEIWGFVVVTEGQRKKEADCFIRRPVHCQLN
jgi:hypothetical protein